MDERLTWKSQITHVNSKISKNLGIFYKLRNYLNVYMLKQLYYTLIYPYLSYGSMSWGSNYSSNLKKLTVKHMSTDHGHCLCPNVVFYSNSI
jgi:hypothetical protein